MNPDTILARRCPTCGARPGQPCEKPAWTKDAGFHVTRLDDGKTHKARKRAPGKPGPHQTRKRLRQARAKARRPGKVRRK